jgi:hypothetical protein
MGIFSRSRQGQGRSLPDASQLGLTCMALRVMQDSLVPPRCVGICISAAGHASRTDAGQRMQLGAADAGYWVHPGPYTCDIVPYAAAPEIGLRLRLVLDTPDPRVAQQRFDLFLASEIAQDLTLQSATPQNLTLDDLCRRVQTTLQDELARGGLALEPCASPEEWTQFRAGLNQLLYTRFGLIVEECLPVDLGDTIDYAQLLLQRRDAEPETEPELKPAHTEPAAAALWPMIDDALPVRLPAAKAAPTTSPTSATRLAAGLQQRDALGVRRLFLELPQFASGLRLIAWPPGQTVFRQRQALLQRIDFLSLSASTMTALAWASPDQMASDAQQARRADHLQRAVAGLDEAWALLARLQLAGDGRLASNIAQRLETEFEQADRILSNIESHLAARRSTQPEPA